MSSPLAGQHIALTGRLASLSREEAATRIRELGGEYVTQVRAETTLLVVGRDGFPLARDGRLSRNLQAAQELRKQGSCIQIVPEEEFLRRVGWEEKEDAIHQLYSSAQLSRILGVSEQRIRSWMRRKLITPVRQEQRVCYFDFQQVSIAKSISELTQAGVTPQQLRRSFEQLDQWLPVDAAASLQQLNLVGRDGELMVRLGDGKIADASGQLQFDFSEPEPAEEVEEPEPASVSPLSAGRSSDEWFEQGVLHEEAGRWQRAREAYEASLESGGATPEIFFNLGNVLFELGETDDAAASFRRAVEDDPQYVEAWSNLGSVLSELGDLDGAEKAFRTAIAIAPLYADAHYNLAETLDQLGRRDEAARHWQAYLSQDPHSSWAREVRRRLRV